MKRVLFFLIAILPLLSYAQNEAAIWYFGEQSGLDFNSGVPVVLTDGVIDTFEGCATISDSTGQLLFYTDGVNVWDRTHNLMPNGTGLDGNSSSSQSAIIVPKPNNVNQYYIITVDDNPTPSNFKSGINYSTIDMISNAGNGDVISKNNLMKQYAFEKITSVRHANNNDFWVISFITDSFYAWLIDASGVSTTPVISSAGVSSINASRGYLKTSIDGSKIASANFGTNGTLMLYDFNTTTGIVTNEQQLQFEDSADIPYGVEFSNSGDLVYATTCRISGFGLTGPGRLYQFDLQNSNARVKIDDQNVYTRGALQLAIDGKIYRALSTVTTAQNTASGTDFLGVINAPNLTGLACNYVADAIDVTVAGAFPSHRVFEGLPPFMTSYFVEPSITAYNVCLGDITEFTLNSETPPTSVTWDFGDPASGVDNTSTNIINPTLHTFTSSGVFTVTATVDIGGVITVLTIDITIFDLPVVTSPVTLTQCDDDLDGIVDFNLSEANSLISTNYLNEIFTYFLTENDAINNINIISNPTTFSNLTAPNVWARIENATGCFTTAEVLLEVTTTNIPSDLMLTFNECDDILDGDDTNGFTTFDFSAATTQILDALLPATNLNVTYFESITDALAEQNSIDPTNYTNTTANSQQLAVRVDDLMNGCFGIGIHITLNIDPVPEFDLSTNATLCLNSGNSTINIENPLTNYEYVWRNDLDEIIGDTPEIMIDSEGTYSVTATDINGNNCETTKSIVVTSAPTTPLLNFDINNILIEDNSSNNTITVLTSNLPNGNYEFALDDGDFQSSNLFENVSAGIHTVRILEVDNCLEGSVDVSLIGVPNFFTPNGDGYNDTWHVTGIEFQPTSNVYVFDRFGKLIAILNPLGPGWNGYYKGNPLPSTDYWYKVELEDGRILKGHFSLIRR